MPINEPIRNRKVAPASLAFERDQMRNGSIFQVGDTTPNVTYQDVVNIRYGDVNNLYITNQYLEVNNDKVMKAIGESEERSKHWVADYKRVFQWDLKQDQAYTFNVWTPIGYNSEILRAVGCRTSGSPVTNTALWEYVVPSDATGSYWIYAHMNLRLNVASAVSSGHLAFFINGILWRIVDQVDNAMMGDNKIIDLRVQGGCHVPLRAGDILTVRLRLDDTAGTDTSIYPTSVYSFVTGHRESCNTEVYTTTSTGQLYQFNKSA